MQHANVKCAWKLTDIDTLITCCYTARINPAKGVPWTTTEFIYYYAEKIVK